MVSKSFPAGPSGWGHGPSSHVTISLGVEAEKNDKGALIKPAPYAGVRVTAGGAPWDGDKAHAEKLQNLIANMYADALRELTTALPLLSLHQVRIIALATQVK